MLSHQHDPKLKLTDRKPLTLHVLYERNKLDSQCASMTSVRPSLIAPSRPFVSTFCARMHVLKKPGTFALLC